MLGPAILFSQAASKLFANTCHCTPNISTHLLAVYLWSLLPQRGSHSQTSLAWTLSEIHKERNTHPKPSVPCPVITSFKAQKRRMPALTGTKHTVGSKGCCLALCKKPPPHRALHKLGQVSLYQNTSEIQHASKLPLLHWATVSTRRQQSSHC